MQSAGAMSTPGASTLGQRSPFFNLDYYLDNFKFSSNNENSNKRKRNDNYYSDNDFYDSALAYWQRAYESGYRSAVLFVNRGIAYLKSKRYEEAVPEFQKAIEIDNKNRLLESLPADDKNVDIIKNQIEKIKPRF